jgi:TatD DNase family protein
MYWIDTHTHIYMDADVAEQDACMERTLAAGVKKIVLAGVDREAIKPIADFCSRHKDNAFAAIGLHPTDVRENYFEELAFMEDVLARANGGSREGGDGSNNKSGVEAEHCVLQQAGMVGSGNRYVAIGETGIDLYHDRSSEKQQEVAFEAQLEWAKKYNLPLIFHVRNEVGGDNAMKKILQVLGSWQDNALRGVFHCYSGDLEQAKQIVDMGFYLGIGGVLTFKNAGALPEVVGQIPIEYLLLETDAPFLAPVPYRGQKNESSYLPLVGYKMAEILKRPVEEIADITSRNAETLLGI